MSLSVYVYVYVYVYVHMHVHVYVYTYAYAYGCACAYVCVWHAYIPPMRNDEEGLAHDRPFPDILSPSVWLRARCVFLL